MAYMTWLPEMSVGVEELDEDHKTLIRIINQLADSLEGEANTAALTQCLNGLARYAEYHFAREEAVMTGCGYAGLTEHQGEHEDFTKTIQAIRSDVDSLAKTEGNERDTGDAGQALLSYLKNWLTHHILTIDMDYRPFVAGRAEAREAAKAFKAAHIWWSG